MNKKLVLAACAATLLTGCGGGGSSTTSPSRQTTEVATDTQTATASYRSVGYSLVVPRQVKSGQPVIMQFTATNNRDTPIIYADGYGSNTQLVVRQNGVVVYDTDLLFRPGIIPPIAKLGPKGILALPMTWDQTDTAGHALGPGTYSVQAFFLPGNDFPDPVYPQGIPESETAPYGAPPVDVVVTP